MLKIFAVVSNGSYLNHQIFRMQNYTSNPNNNGYCRQLSSRVQPVFQQQFWTVRLCSHWTDTIPFKCNTSWIYVNRTNVTFAQVFLNVLRLYRFVLAESPYDQLRKLYNQQLDEGDDEMQRRQPTAAQSKK